MSLRRTVICIAGALIAFGFAGSSQAGGPNPTCELVIEINALRGGSPTVSVGGTKNITAKARIAKGSAPSGTTIDTLLRVEATDGSQVIDAKTAFPIQLVVGKGGQGAKFMMNITQCTTGSIDFAAMFSGEDSTGATCEATRTITKTCK